MSDSLFAIDTLKRQLKRTATAKAEAHSCLITAQGEAREATRLMTECDHVDVVVRSAIVTLGGNPDEPVSQLQPGERL